MSVPVHAESARRARPAAAVWAAALAAVVLLSGIEVRPAAETHDPGAALARHSERYFLGACHPLLPPHAETAKAAWRPLCAVCLNRMQSVGARFGAGNRLWLWRDGRRLPQLPAWPALHRSASADGTRAPPLA
jgi:hypothetical protein